MSTIPPVVAALVAVGEATLDGDDWIVADGPIGTVPTAGQRLLLIADEEIVSTVNYNDLASMGMDDQYLVPLLASVALPGPDTLATARTEALAAYDDIRDALQVLFNLGLQAQGVHKAVVTGEKRVQPFALAEGRSVAVRFYVEVFAQLT
jgi:hypothetical protein